MFIVVQKTIEFHLIHQKFHNRHHANEGSNCITGTMSWMIGNGYCDDGFNKVECNFDGGDCCGSDVNTEYCTNCTCLVEG